MNRYRSVPMGRHADTRIAVTIRLPYDTYREVVSRARSREWSMSHYVAHCITNELAGKPRRDRQRIANHGLELVRGDDAVQ